MKSFKTIQVLALIFVGNFAFSQGNQAAKNQLDNKLQEPEPIILQACYNRCYMGCELPSRVDVSRLSQTIVEAVKEEFTFSVYPNPATDKINIKLDEKVGDFKVYLIDMLGNQVFEKSYSNAEMRSINVSNLKNGCYLMKIVSGEKSAVKQLIINK